MVGDKASFWIGWPGSDLGNNLLKERATMRQRLDELRTELARGREQMLILDQRRQELRDTMLRISGAIQVLEELLSEANARRGEAGHSVNGASTVSAHVG